MFRHWLCAFGFLSIFLAPALLLLGMELRLPYLAFAAVMLVFPLTRKVLPALRADEETLWPEGIATWLHALPLLYAPVLALALVGTAQFLAQRPAGSTLGLGLSLWITLLFSTCAAHELVHRRDRAHAAVGHLIAGLAGYPFLAQEHLAHHARAGDTRNAEWPRVGESVWAFALRRGARILREAYSPKAAFWTARARGHSARGLRLATAVTVATGALFGWAAGPMAVLLYLAAALGTIFGVQVINYIQHWGLGEDRQGARACAGLGWEDDCRFQAWCTLGISLHQAHHDRSHLPYYRVRLKPDSPRLPAGYIFLMLLSLAPALWRRLMLPALEHWERSPHCPRSPGRRLACFSAYRSDEGGDFSP